MIELAIRHRWEVGVRERWLELHAIERDLPEFVTPNGKTGRPTVVRFIGPAGVVVQPMPIGTIVFCQDEGTESRLYGSGFDDDEEEVPAFGAMVHVEEDAGQFVDGCDVYAYETTEGFNYLWFVCKCR